MLKGAKVLKYLRILIPSAGQQNDDKTKRGKCVKKERQHLNVEVRGRIKSNILPALEEKRKIFRWEFHKMIPSNIQTCLKL